MDNEKSELHKLFEKLDAVTGDHWRLERSAAGWTVTQRHYVVSAATPEEACRGMLATVLAAEESNAQLREESAQAARDRVAEVRRHVDKPSG